MNINNKTNCKTSFITVTDLIILEMKLCTFEPNQAPKRPVSATVQGNSISLSPKYRKDQSNNGWFIFSSLFIFLNHCHDL